MENRSESCLVEFVCCIDADMLIGVREMNDGEMDCWKLQVDATALFEPILKCPVAFMMS
jgi:hypothetical protein